MSKLDLMNQIYFHLASLGKDSAYAQYLPSIQADINTAEAKISSGKFDSQVALYAAGGMVLLRLLSKPVLLSWAEKASAKERKKTAAFWRMADKLWLGMQAFSLASAYEIYKVGGPKNQAEKALEIAGGVILLGSIIHLGIDFRRKRKNE